MTNELGALTLSMKWAQSMTFVSICKIVVAETVNGWT